MTRREAFYRHAMRALHAARGPGVWSDAIGTLFTLSLYAILAIGLAAIGD